MKYAFRVFNNKLTRLQWKGNTVHSNQIYVT